MRINDNYISVIAQFIGKDGSRGFKKGTLYLLKMKITDGYIIVSSEKNESLWCPYSSINTFLENWKLNSGEDEMSELKRPVNHWQPTIPSINDVLIDIIDKQLVVVPQIVADYIETQKDNIYDGSGCLIFKHYNSFKQDGDDSELNIWIADNFNTFLEAIVNGYTVEKEKKYILKHIDMSKLYTDVSLYLAHGFYKELDHIFYKDANVHNAEECHFTQSEIDKLNIGSYEQIEVEP